MDNTKTSFEDQVKDAVNIAVIGTKISGIEEDIKEMKSDLKDLPGTYVLQRDYEKAHADLATLLTETSKLTKSNAEWISRVDGTMRLLVVGIIVITSAVTWILNTVINSLHLIGH